MLVALTRAISPAITRCELTHVERRPIDVDVARAQHGTYQTLLRTMGCAVRQLPADETMPDSVFVEDIAVVLDEMAIVTRPGAVSRRLETPIVAEALRPHRPLVAIEPPGTMDGGDVLTIGRRIFVGESARTNASAIEQLTAAVRPLGYAVTPVRVTGCLHLKSAVTQVAADAVLVNRHWVAAESFDSLTLVDVDEGEPHAANALSVRGRVIYSSAFPATRRRLESLGIGIVPVDVSELAKAEGGVTCCSLIFDSRS
jgi:dimethylargininase